MKAMKIAASAACCLLLWGCLLTPGKFESSLSIRRDGTFTYAYSGEIVLLNAAAAPPGPEETFDPEAQVCGGMVDLDAEASEDEDVDSAMRACTEEEIAEKRTEWEQGAAERAAKRRQEQEITKAVLGGIDPNDTKTMDEFARRLQGQEGWQRVVHKGKGVFDVRYQLSGRMDHAFVFPVFPSFEIIFPFVQVARESGGKVRVTAPAFAQRKGNDAWSGMGAGLMAGSEGLPSPEGTFTLTTDAGIVTNNTQDGPAGPAGAKVLRWVIGPLDSKKPEALLQL